MRKSPVVGLRLRPKLSVFIYESCLKLNENCLQKFADENAKEQLNGVTEDVAELTLIVGKTDKLLLPLKSKENKLKSFSRTFRS